MFYNYLLLMLQYLIPTSMALSSSREAVPGITRDAPPPTALPIRPDVIGLPPIAEFMRENGRLPIQIKYLYFKY